MNSNILEKGALSNFGVEERRVRVNEIIPGVSKSLERF